MSTTTIIVHGIPAPQGSKRHVGNGILVESSKMVKPWREAVKWAAREIWAPRITGPVRVDIVFTLPRPKKYLPVKHKNALPVVQPDGDKLERATWDALTQAGVIEDDARVVAWSGRKCYAGSDHGMATPGAVIVVSSVGVGEEANKRG